MPMKKSVNGLAEFLEATVSRNTFQQLELDLDHFSESIFPFYLMQTFWLQ